MNTYSTGKEVGSAVKRRESSFIVEGDITKKIMRIKITGPLAWAVCIVSLGASIALYSATPAIMVVTAPAAGVGGVISFTGASTVATVAATTGLGTATTTAIAIGVAGGGIGAVTTLRNRYRIEKIGNKKIKMTLK